MFFSITVVIYIDRWVSAGLTRTSSDNLKEEKQSMFINLSLLLVLLYIIIIPRLM